MDSSPPNRERERNLALERERQIEMASSRATTSCTYDTGLREEPPTLAQRDLIATVLDLKVDVRLEMQRMSQRIGKIEDLLQELCKKKTITQDSSGQTTPGDGVDEIPALLSHTLTLTTAGETTKTTSSMSISGSSIQAGGSSDVVITPTSTATNISAPPTTSQLHVPCSGGNGLGPILLKKRRSKSRKAPAPPKQSQTSPEQTRLLEAELITTTSSTPTTSTPSTSSKSKREFL